MKSNRENTYIPALTGEYVFLYLDEHPNIRWAEAYVVTPGAGNTSVQHQWGCVDCNPFSADNCKVDEAPWRFLNPAISQMDCQRIMEIVEQNVRKIYPGADIEVLGEALIKVTQSGSTFFICTENCD